MPQFPDDGPPFSRRAFEWKRELASDGAAQAPKADQKEKDGGAVANRVYEVAERTCTVRTEPHLKARMKTRKSCGARVVCSEITMNGWLKLCSEPGWLLCNMQGIDGVCDVAYPADSLIFLAVPVYQAQGMCCLEVVSDDGVPVRESPDKLAKTLTTVGAGEYIFSHTQNFDGWLRLAPGEGGWICCQGEATLLSLRTDTREVDLWALADLWASARRASGRLSPEDAESLKELERTIASEAKAVLEELPDAELDGLVEDGFLEAEDTSQPRSWVAQRLFAHMLEQTVADDPRFKDFKLSRRVPPLPAAVEGQGAPEEEDMQLTEDEQAASEGPDVLDEGGQRGSTGEFSGRGTDNGTVHREVPSADERLQPFEHDGQRYLRAPNGVLFTDPSRAPVGLWNPSSSMIDPVAGLMPGCPYDAISYFGKTFLLMSDNKLLDWDTQEVFAVSDATDVKKIILQL